MALRKILTPSDCVGAAAFCPVASFVKAQVAPATAAPEEPVTDPFTELDTFCPQVSRQAGRRKITQRKLKRV